jgi:hypothetical protein
LSAGQPIRVRLLSGYLPSIGKRHFDRDDLFPRSHAAYGPLGVLRPNVEGDGFFGEMGRPPMLVLDAKNALSRSSTSPSISPAVTRIPFLCLRASQKRRRNVVAVSLGFLCGMGRRHPIAVGAGKAETLLRNLARHLEKDWEGVSASILEGLDELLTVTKLGLPPESRRSPRLHEYHRECHGHGAARQPERKILALAFDGSALGRRGHAGSRQGV